MLKDAGGKVLPGQPLPGLPVVYVHVLVPASAQLGDGAVEGVMLLYLPLEADRVRDGLTKKYGESHPPENKVNPREFEEFWGATLISREVWKTEWGEVFLGITDKDVTVIATTTRLASFERENRKDEF